MNAKTLTLSLTILLILIVSLILMHHNTTKAVLSPTSSSTTHSPDSYMLNVAFSDYNDKGQLHSYLYTPKMTHYRKRNISYFTSPKVLIYTASRIPWQIRARYGKSNSNHWIHLWQNVKLHQLPSKNHPDTIITTSALTFYPNKSYAKSSHKIVIKQPNSTIHGIGLKANFKTGNYTLLSQSRGIYVPKKKNPS